MMRQSQALVRQLAGTSQQEPQSMEPWDFAAKWVPQRRFGVQPGEYGFKKQAAHEISRALEGIVSVTTITRNWGKNLSKCPAWVPLTLGMIDRLREVESLGKQVTGLGLAPFDDDESF